MGRVMNGSRLEVPLLDQLPGPDTVRFAGLPDYIALMQRCWAQAPADRPGFQEIVVQLRWGAAAWFSRVHAVVLIGGDQSS